ncbi:glycosyltransferase [Alphaproteobacteria bacterium]|nr:glycosyltransferase [Alphaproteobacteria bacterium]
MIDLVTVIMPVYNASKYLDKSIQSILNQTYKDFKFIILNDGSTDNSLDIIKKYSDTDSRIELVDKPNSGAASSFNYGLKICNSKYIARMDSDDISMPDRLHVQINYLEKYKNIDVLGSAIKTIDENDNELKSIFFPDNYSDIIDRMDLTSPIANPSAMIKKSVFEDIGDLDTNTDPADDYDFLVKAVVNKKIITNINQILLKYRLHQENLSKINHHKQIKFSYNSRKMLIEEGLLSSKITEKEYQIRNLPSITDFEYENYKNDIKSHYKNDKKNKYFYLEILSNLFARRLINNKFYLKGSILLFVSLWHKLSKVLF